MKPKVRFGGTDNPVCVQCGRERDPEQLDRYFWCDECRKEARAVATRWGRIIGLVGTLALAIYVGQSLAPSGRWLIAWAAVILVTYRILGRLGREMIFSVMRIRAYRAYREMVRRRGAADGGP